MAKTNPRLDLVTGTRLIERAISPDGTPVIGLLLFMAYGRLIRSRRRGTRFAAINPLAIGVPALLKAHPGLSQTELADLLGIERMTAGLQVAQCLRQGLITRRRSARDKRKYALFVTAKGRANLRRVAALIPHHEESMFGKIGARDRRVFYRVLGSLLDSAGQAQQ